MLNLDFRRLPQAVAVFLLVAVVVPVVVAGMALWAYLFLPLPTPTLPDPKPGPEASRITRIFDGQGNEIGILRRFDTSIPVEPEDIPDVLKQAVVAVEDQRFYSHSGLDVRAAIRAFWADVQGRAIVQGGSTITQQYVKGVYTGGERTFQRKLKEAVIASRIDRQLSKDEILFRYLSTIYFGGGAYGAGAAAESYFGKRVNDLTLSESAMLAGIIKAPGELDPHVNLAGAERARVDALRQMLQQGRINQAEHDEAVAQRLRLATTDGAPEGPATLIQPIVLQSAEYPYFVDAVRRYLLARYGDDLVYGGGLQVVASIDPKLQALAEAAVAKSLEGTQPPLELALVSVEPSTGLVKAIVGGRDFNESQVNLALGNCPERDQPMGPVNRPTCLSGGGSGRQPGSSFKPFTLAAAFEQGIGPGRVYSAPASYTFPSQFCTGECTVRNVGGGGYGALTLRQATWSSVNTVYAQLITDVGVAETAELANRLGVTMVSPDGLRPDGQVYGASLTLGSAEVSPYDMAAAFGVFANRGLQQPATPVVKVTDADGNVLEDNSARAGRRVISQAVADNVTDVLQGVVVRGTGTAAAIGRPEGTAGKTGTSESFGDAWFVGFTKHLSTAVWMGYADSRRELRNIGGYGVIYGGTIPAVTWKAFMGPAHEGLPEADFDAPAPLAGDVGAGPRRAPAQFTAPAVPRFVIGAPQPAVTTTTTRPPFLFPPTTARSTTTSPPVITIPTIPSPTQPTVVTTPPTTLPATTQPPPPLPSTTVP